MKKEIRDFALKASAAALAVAFGGSALAAYDLDANAGAAVVASEQKVTTAATLSGAAGLSAGATFGATMPAGTQAYVRVDLSGGGATFASVPTGTHVNGTSNQVGNGWANSTVAVAQGGTVGSSYVIFSVAPTNASSYLINANSFNVAANVNVNSQAAVNVQYRLYETLTAAVNQSPSTALKDKSGAFVTFGSSISKNVVKYDGTKTAAIADVGATTPYTKFTADNINATTVALGRVNAAANGTVVLQDGTASNFAAILNNAATATVVSVSGDFSASANADATFNAAAVARVYLSKATDCSAVDYNATSLSSTSASWNNVNANAMATANGVTICYTPNGTTAVPASSYTGAVDWTGNTGFTVADFSLLVGDITRNGTTMVAPLAQIPTGWISRLVLMNKGTADRAYTISAVTESGTTVTLGTGSTGSLTANQTKVIDLTGMMTVTAGNPRSSLVVVVNGPQSSISGLYQIVNGTTGSISNHVLDYK